MSAFLSRADVPSLALGLCAVAAIVALAFVAFDALDGERQRLRRRVARVGAQLAAKEADLAPAAPTLRRNLSDSSIESLDKLIKRFLPHPAKLRERLAATGRRIALGEYVLASALAGVVVYLAFAAIGVSAAAAFLFALAAVLGLPYLATGIMIRRRRATFIQLFPEAIDLIVRGLRSGLPVTESIKVVGDELPDPVGVEFRRIIESFSFGLSLADALAVAAQRIDAPEFRFFVISLSIQQETGGNLTETLENLSVILRRRKQMKLKIRAMSSEARASAMIIGALPVIMFALLLVVDPNYAMVMIKDPRGRFLLGVGIGSMATGMFTMMRMARFEI